MTHYLLKRSTEIRCVGWDTLESLLSAPGKKGWTLDRIDTAPSRGGADYIRKGDRVCVVNTPDGYQLILARAGIPDRIHRDVHLEGVQGHPNLWARANANGLDMYLYLVDTPTSTREVHVEVFYIGTSHDSERPAEPNQVEIL